MKLQFNKIDCFKSLLSKCLQQLLIYKHRRKSRRALLKLDERMLNDIGLNKDQAYKEGKKPFWEGGSSVFDKKKCLGIKRLFSALLSLNLAKYKT